MTTKLLHGVVQHLRRTALVQDDQGRCDGELLADYVARRDEAAFAALVRRHGPMVFGVCSRILCNQADAEDAFQATFLVLVRKARSLRSMNLVGNWLYGVAHNIALKARAMIHLRHAKERAAAALPRPGAGREVWEQVQSILDQEMSALPDKYRAVIVLCDLEGKTIKEAAARLGWPQGTAATRLARGRALLGQRMSRHGLTLTAGTLAAVLAGGETSLALSAELTVSTIQAGAGLAAGRAACISARVLTLMEGALQAMLLAKLKGILKVAALGLLLGVVALWTWSAWSAQPGPEAPKFADKKIEPKAKPNEKPKPKPDITVVMKAWLFEVDDEVHQKLAKAKRLTKEDLEEMERIFLGLEKPRPDPEAPLYQALAKQKPLVAGKDVDTGLGRDEVLLSWRKAKEFLPTPEEARRGGKKPQVVEEGVLIHAAAQVSADRRYVRVKFTEKSVEVEGVEKVEVPVGETDDKAAAATVFLRELSHSQVRDLPDGGHILLPIHHRQTQDKNRRLILRVTARIVIEEEERLIREQEGK